jgi:hypothetical protein
MVIKQHPASTPSSLPTLYPRYHMDHNQREWRGLSDLVSRIMASPAEIAVTTHTFPPSCRPKLCLLLSDNATWNLIYMESN